MVKPFTHPKYEALKQRDEFSAKIWLMGHVFFVLFLALALVGPLVVALIPILYSDLPKDRVGDGLISSSVACLLLSLMGFAVRQYAARKGRA